MFQYTIVISFVCLCFSLQIIAEDRHATKEKMSGVPQGLAVGPTITSHICSSCVKVTHLQNFIVEPFLKAFIILLDGDHLWMYKTIVFAPAIILSTRTINYK